VRLKLRADRPLFRHALILPADVWRPGTNKRKSSAARYWVTKVRNVKLPSGSLFVHMARACGNGTLIFSLFGATIASPRAGILSAGEY